MCKAMRYHEQALLKREEKDHKYATKGGYLTY
jgi:hypothetical protein